MVAFVVKCLNNISGFYETFKQNDQAVFQLYVEEIQKADFRATGRDKGAES